MIHHFSFDVWNTLVKPNPAYAEARTARLAKLFDMDEYLVRHHYTNVKKWIDQHAIETGFAPSQANNIRMLMMTCGVHANPQTIANDFTFMFFEHPPIVLDETKEVLKELKKQGATLSIGSNSNFISGREMRKFLGDTFGYIFKFGVYSDLLERAKPSRAFFNEIIFNCDVAANEIMHVGDHAVCDLQGAQNAGMHGLLLEKPEDIGKVLQQYEPVS